MATFLRTGRTGVSGLLKSCRHEWLHGAERYVFEVKIDCDDWKVHGCIMSGFTRRLDSLS